MGKHALMETMPVEAIAPPPTVSPANVAPHLPPPTEIPLPGPAEPIQLAEKPSHAVSGGSSEEKELEAMVDEISAALTSLGMNEGERNPQAGKGQLTLKDMKAAVWLPRLPKKRELEGTPNVAVLDTHGVLRPVANPHSKPAAPPIPHEPSEDRDLSSEDWGQYQHILYIWVSCNGTTSYHPKY